MKLALFDLDHTLIPLDSDYTWGVFTTQLGWTDPVEFARRNDDFYARYKAGTLDIHEYVRFATDAMRLQGAAKAEQALRQFIQEIIKPALHPAALALVKQHQASDDAVLIVTATNTFITRPIADLFGVSELIAVELEHALDADGANWISGAIKGVPSVREGKVARIQTWLAQRGLSLADVEATFYSDSINDLPLLEQVTYPVATNPDAPLRAIAQQRGWRILDLFPQNS